MKPFVDFPKKYLRKIRFLVTDIDDTLTLHGVLPAQVYANLQFLRSAGVQVILITGRPAGWCDMIARFWPVDAVVGENGSFYFKPEAGHIKRVWIDDAPVRAANLKRLTAMAEQIITEFKGTALAEDNPWRATDIAVDFAEDVSPLPLQVADQICQRFIQMGATAKVSSIHVNAWIGAYDKLSMFEKLLANEFGCSVKDVLDQAIYTGDSPNDAPMFRRFDLSVGVKSVTAYSMATKDLPKYITKGDGANGFLEVSEKILHNRETK